MKWRESIDYTYFSSQNVKGPLEFETMGPSHYLISCRYRIIVRVTASRLREVSQNVVRRPTKERLDWGGGGGRIGGLGCTNYEYDVFNKMGSKTWVNKLILPFKF